MFISFLLYMYSIYSYNRYVNRFSDFYTLRRRLLSKTALRDPKKKENEADEGGSADKIPKSIRHVDAVLKFLSVFAEDLRFLNLHLSKRKEETNMCEILDRIEKIGEDPAYYRQLLRKYNLI